MKKLDIERYIKKYLMVIIQTLILSLVGYILLSIVYCIPTDGRIYHNMEKSVSFFENEGDYPQLMDNFNSRLDDWTDALMLLEAANEDNGNPFVASLESLNLSGSNIGPRETLLIKYSENKSNKTLYNASYGRYWHGYLLILKPLLWLFDYGTIRSIFASVHISLFSLVVFLLKNNKKFIIPFIVFYLFLNPAVSMLSLQFSWITFLTFIFCILIIRYREWLIKDQKFFFVFAFVGSLTSYIDLLTFPLISLGVPLILWIGLKEKTDWKENLLEIASLSISWAIGYGLMWSMKWVFASLFTSYNIVTDAMTAIADRTSNYYWDDQFTYFDIIYRNLGCSFQIAWFIIVIVYFVLSIKKLIMKRNFNLNTLLPLVFIGIFPFLWAAVLQNHTYSHCFFTYRIFGISVFAFMVYATDLQNSN